MWKNKSEKNKHDEYMKDISIRRLMQLDKNSRKAANESGASRITDNAIGTHILDTIDPHKKVNMTITELVDEFWNTVRVRDRLIDQINAIVSKKRDFGNYAIVKQHNQLEAPYPHAAQLYKLRELYGKFVIETDKLLYYSDYIADTYDLEYRFKHGYRQFPKGVNEILDFIKNNFNDIKQSLYKARDWLIQNPMPDVEAPYPMTNIQVAKQRARKGEFKTNANVAQFLVNSIYQNRIPLETAKRVLPKGKTSNLNEAGVYAAAMSHMMKTPLYKKHPDLFKNYYKKLKGIYTTRRRGVANNSNTLRSNIATMNKQELRDYLHDIEEELEAFKPMTSYFGKHSRNEREIANIIRQWLKASRESVRKILREKYGVDAVKDMAPALALALAPPVIMDEVIVENTSQNKNNAPLIENAERPVILNAIRLQSIRNQSTMKNKRGTNSFFGRFSKYFTKNNAATKKKNNNINLVTIHKNNRSYKSNKSNKSNKSKKLQNEEEEKEGEATRLLSVADNGNNNKNMNGNNGNNGNNNESSVRKRLLA
jgi:hypothetical protein